MQASNRVLSDELSEGALPRSDATSSGVSWAAIFVGAAAAAALSLVLMILGFGLGLSAISPWTDRGAEASTIGMATIAWIIFTQIAAAALGGYLAGRLRIKWARLHTDEVYFRDTAHGLLAWAVATLMMAGLLGSAASGALSGGLQAGAGALAGIGTAATHIAAANSSSNGNGAATDNLKYYVDRLFRGTPPVADGANGAGNRDTESIEAVRIFANDVSAGELNAEDKQYLGQIIARRTGLSQADAEQRASDIFYQLTTSIAKAKMTAKEAADKALKAAAHTSLWMFVALLCGAFGASLAATMGGRQRDRFD